MHAALRDNDQLQICELHPAELDALKIWQQHNPKARIHQRDALEALVALLPPTIKRGIVLIDPSYEIKTDYQSVATSLIEAVAKWPQGIFLLWYPLLNAERHRDMLKRLIQRCKLPMLQSELIIRDNAPDGEYGGGMYGSGMLIINPPWQLDTQIQTIAPWLEHLCEKNQSDAGHKQVWLREAV
jgi:23S rRNA (adenine2030-N6)-methyltransferase